MMEPIAAHVVLGQEQEKLTDGFNEDQSFSGRMSQVGLWNRILSREELEQMASCAIEFPTGSVIPWNMGSWNISDHVGQETTKATFCQDDPLEDILLISDPISADENLELCQKVGGSVPYASTASELEVVIKRVLSPTPGTIPWAAPSASGTGETWRAAGSTPHPAARAAGETLSIA